MTEASLFEPRLVSALSAWNEHIPLAGWLIEATTPKKLVELGTHAGVSYFAFCEAVQRLGLNTQCYAVDHWVGDEHSGAYGEDVYRSVVSMNSHYQSFSHLLRTTFDEGARDFAEGSVDLLHIDGLHTYEAVAHDFETWLPRMSARGVMAFHDTNERKADFGVYKLFAELGERFPSFEFKHGHGLGIVAVGSEVPVPLQELVAIDPSSEDALFVRETYRLLGSRFALQVEVEKLNRRVSELERDLASQRSRGLDQTEAIVALNEEIATLKQRRSAELDSLSGAVRKTSSLEETIASKDAQIRRLEKTIKESSIRNLEATRALARSEETRQEPRDIHCVEDDQAATPYRRRRQADRANADAVGYGRRDQRDRSN